MTVDSPPSPLRPDFPTPSGGGSFRRVLLASLLLAAAATSLVVVALDGVEKRVRSYSTEVLSTVVAGTHDALRQGWLANLQRGMAEWAAEPDQTAAARELGPLSRSKDALRQHPRQQMFRDAVEPRIRFFGALGATLIGPDGTTLADWDRQLVGTVHPLGQRQPELLARVLGGQPGLSHPYRSEVPLPDEEGRLHPDRPTLFFLAPVPGPDGSAAAVFGIRVDPRRAFVRLLAAGRVGTTGETLAFDGDGLLLSPSRFGQELHAAGRLPTGQDGMLTLSLREPASPGSAESPGPPTRAVREATAGRRGSAVEAYRSYRGTPVLGAWLWDDELQLGLVSEIDEAEALTPYRRTRALVVALVGATGALALVVLLILASIERRLRRSAQDARDYLRAVVDAAGDGVITLGPDGEIDLANETARQLLGPATRRGTPLQERLTPDAWERFCDLQRQAADGRAAGELVVRAPGGPAIPVHVGIRPTALDDRSLTVVTLRDLRELRRALADTERAERLAAAKSAFLAQLSHEVRTPLNAILGFAQLMAEDESLEARSTRRAETIVRAGRGLLRLVNETLELAKMEAGRLPVAAEPFSPRDLLQGLAQLHAATAEAKGLTLAQELSDELPGMLVGDPHKLSQILGNLLGNAVKFTEAGSVTVAARPSVDGSSVIVEVINTGPGIEPQDRERIFEEFEQTDLGRNRTGSTGLGLPISRQLAELLGGSLVVTSEPGKGSRFIATFPLREAAEAATPKQPPAPPPGSRPWVLLVDDDPDSRSVMAAMLKSAGYRLREVDRGEAALKLFREHTPPVVVTDLRLPDTDGYEVTRQLLALRPSTKVVIATADASFDGELAAQQAGAVAFIRKPFLREQLLAAVAAAEGSQKSA